MSEYEPDELLQYYIVFDDDGFKVGTYAFSGVITERRYFHWRSSEWHELDLEQFTLMLEDTENLVGEVTLEDMNRFREVAHLTPFPDARS